MTLTEFLLARIAEDEAVARDWRHHRGKVSVLGGGTGYEAWCNPARVLAECEAKRRIVEQYEFHRDQVTAYRNPRWRDAMNEDDKRNWHQAEARHRVAEDVACLLALPYAEHPDMPKDPSQPEG